jgi:glycosyltransferase involved in cell wall biosynthesis
MTQSDATQPRLARPRVVHITAIDSSVMRLLMNQLLHLQASGFDVRVICSPGPNRQAIEQRGIAVYPVPLPRRLSPLTNVISLVKMASILRRQRIDIVHGHTLNGVLWGQLAGRLAGCPVVLQTVHGFFFHDNMRPLTRRALIQVERVAAWSSDAMLSQSLEDIATATAEGIGSHCRHVTHLGNGIDLSLYNPGRFTAADRQRVRGELGFGPEDKVVVIVGRLARDKGYYELCEAMRTVVQQHPHARLLSIGPGDEERVATFDPAALGLTKLPWARFLGRREDVPQLLHAADLAVLPSHYEGYPRFLMEAHAMGLATIATDVRGCREVVSPGVTGRLVPLGDAAALAEAIAALLADDAMRRAYGAAAVRRAAELFDERDVFRRVEQTYRLLLAEKNVCAPRHVGGAGNPL